jgi:hypothetical protein
MLSEPVRASSKVALVGIGTHPSDTDKPSNQTGQSTAGLGYGPSTHQGIIMNQRHLILALLPLTVSSVGCAMQTDAANDELPVEVDVTESELRQGAQTTQNGYGRSIQNLKGVNMQLDNFIRGSTNLPSAEVRFWANDELPPGATVIDAQSHHSCKRSDGTTYSKYTPRKEIEFLFEAGDDLSRLDTKKIRLTHCDNKTDSLLSTTLFWGVDN